MDKQEISISEQTKIELTQFLDFLLKEGYCDVDVYAEPPTAIDQYLAGRKHESLQPTGKAYVPVKAIAGFKESEALPVGEGTSCNHCNGTGKIRGKGYHDVEEFYKDDPPPPVEPVTKEEKYKAYIEFVNRTNIPITRRMAWNKAIEWLQSKQPK